MLGWPTQNISAANVGNTTVNPNPARDNGSNALLPANRGVISMTFDEEGPEAYTSARDVVVGWIIVAVLLLALALLSPAA